MQIFFCWWFFWTIRWSYDDFFREFIFRLWSNFFDRNVSWFDCFSNFNWFDANNDIFSKNNQFCNAVLEKYHSNINESYFAHSVFFFWWCRRQKTSEHFRKSWKIFARNLTKNIQTYSIIEWNFDEFRKNWLYDFRWKTSILLQRHSNCRIYMRWRKKTFEHCKNHQNREMICLYKCRWSTWIYWNMCILSHFHRKIRHHFRFNLYAVEKECDF